MAAALGHTLAGEELLVGGRAGRRHVDDDRAAQAESLDEGVLELHEPGGGMDDLDPDGRLAQGAVQEAADLEAADAQPLADLILGQVQPVVELGGAKHQPGFQPQLVLPEDRGVGGHAQMCNILRICSKSLCPGESAVKGYALSEGAEAWGFPADRPSRGTWTWSVETERVADEGARNASGTFRPHGRQ